MLIALYFSSVKGGIINDPCNPGMQGFTRDLCSSSSNPTHRPCSQRPSQASARTPRGPAQWQRCPCHLLGDPGQIFSQFLTTIIRFYNSQELLHGHQSKRNTSLWTSGELPEGCLGFYTSTPNPEPSESDPGMLQIHHGLMGTEECSGNSPVSRPPCNFTAIWGPGAPQKVLK